MNEYLDSIDFIIDTSMAWAHKFKYAKTRVRKVYPKLILLIFHSLNFSRAIVDHDEYDHDLYIERVKVLAKMAL